MTEAEDTNEVAASPGDRLVRTGVAVAAAAAAGAALALVVRDQIHRNRRDLFSKTWLRRLAALGYMAKERPSVDNVNLLRDFIAREPTRLLRARAAAILERMEGAVHAEPPVPTHGV